MNLLYSKNKSSSRKILRKEYLKNLSFSDKEALSKKLAQASYLLGSVFAEVKNEKELTEKMVKDNYLQQLNEDNFFKISPSDFEEVTKLFFYYFNAVEEKDLEQKLLLVQENISFDSHLLG